MRAHGAVFPADLAISGSHAGERRSFAANLRDLTEKHAAERERGAAAAFLQALMDDRRLPRAR